MYLPIEIAYKLGFILYPFFLLGKKQVGQHIYQVSNNIKLILRENSADVFVLWEVFNRKVYRLEGFDIKPYDTVVDIGGHIGVFAVYAAKKASKGLVLAYEPVKDNFQLLRQNKTLNKLSNLKIFNQAISGDGSDLTLNLSASNSASHSIYMVDSTKKIRVHSITIGDVFKLNHLSKINLLKLDVEGAEFDIILNSPKFVFNKIDKMIVEYHDYVAAEHNHHQLVKFLEGCGFNVIIKEAIWERLIFKQGLIFAYKR